nr:MAG TPA: Putative tail protein [Caudoviricetes sp.]
MINVSDEFKQLMTERQDFKCNAEVTLANGTVLPLGEDDFSIDNNSLVDAAGANTIPLGVALSRNVQLEIMNGDDHLSNYDFFGAKIRLYLTFELSETTEKIEYGTFTVTQPEGYGNVVTIVGYDDMYKADKAYSTTLTFPATAKSVLIDSCDTCGILIGDSNFLHNDFQIPSMPSSEYTHRQIIGFIAMIACGNARIDRTGRLQIMTYDFNYDSGNVHTLTDYNTLTNDTNDVQVTGVQMTKTVTKTTTDEDGNENEEDVEELVKYGSDGYVLEIENPLVAGHEETLVSWIYERFKDVTFRGFTMDYISYPIAEFGDKIKITDWRGKSFYSVLTDVNFVFFGYTTLKNSAESPMRNQSNYTSSEQKALIQGKELVEREKTNRENAIKKLNETLKSGSGLYSTEEKQPDGSSIYYLHDKRSLAESRNVIKLTSDAIGFSTDGGKNYPYGFTITGEMITRLLYTEGINADYINTGALTVKDKSGNIIFYADMETGTVKISGDNVTIGGKTAPEAISDAVKESKNYADGKVSDFAETVTKSVADLQNQIDGQIETFYYDYEPTLKNIPASDWTTEDDKKKHEGDLFYWKSKGYAYRFFKDGDTWKWQLVQDTDVTKALRTASFAQSTADSKCRVFLTQPTPPYDTGDMWNQGQNGDILTCVVARGEGASYVETDWQKLNKYTDDETANKALEEARKSRAMIINLDNDYQAITTDYKGEYTSFPECHTTAQVLYGHTDISNDCTYNVQKSGGVVGSWNSSTHTYTVTALTTDVGWVDITANYLNTYSVTKRFDIAKLKGGIPGETGAKGETGATGPQGEKGATGPQGSAGRTYFMETSSSIVKMSADNTIVPNYITLSGYYRDGTATARTAYECRFKIEETTDGDTYTTVYTSSEDETDITHALYSVLASDSSGVTASGSSGIGISRNLTALRCTMYAAGGFSQVLDIETIPVAIDVDALTHEDIFNLLTNDGAWQGIYRGSDGKLYINFTYARGGTLNLGGKANTYGNGQMHVYDANDNEIVGINTKGIVVTHYISGMGEKPISYVCITPDVFGGIYLSENKDGTGACAILSPDEIVLKNNSSGPLTVQTDITMHMTDESLYLGSISEYKFHFGKERSSFYQPVTIGGSLSVTGEKNRIIDTENYDTRKQYCYETATPYFGDIGTAQTDDKGKCYIDIDDIFSETVNTGVEYQVFLQKEGQGDLWVEEKTDSYFVVRGTENLKFSWEIKAIQRDYEFERLEKFDNSEKEEVIDYEKEYMEEINDLIKEQEEMLNETVE